MQVLSIFVFFLCTVMYLHWCFGVYSKLYWDDLTKLDGVLFNIIRVPEISKKLNKSLLFLSVVENSSKGNGGKIYITEKW